MPSNALLLTRGEDRDFEVTVVDKDGVPIDLAGVYLWFTAKTNLTDIDSRAFLLKTSDSGIAVEGPSTNGKAKVAVSRADSLDWPGTRAQTFFWELQGEDTDGNHLDLARGVLVLRANVVRAPV